MRQRSTELKEHDPMTSATTPRPLVALDLFAGTGWGVACRELGIEEYGVEVMPEACAVRELNGMTTIYNDVWDGLVENDEGKQAFFDDYDLLIASPPCQTFSMAGGGAGRKALDEVLAAIDARLYLDPAKLVAFGETHDPKTALVLAPPLAHIYLDVPQYVVLEQVPPVLPVWERYAEEMRRWGYSVWTGNLQAEMYGTVVTCPLHSATAGADADRAFALDPAALAIADPAGTALNAWLERAEIAEARETFIRERASVESARRSKPGMTEGAASERAAWNAALVSRAVLEDARDATWRELVKPLLSRALAETRTLPGRAGDMSMSAATSGFASTALIAGSIESLPSRLWAALCDLAKSYTTSTDRPTTTIRETSPSSVATPSRYYSRDPQRLDEGVLPWVSMAEALGWGMTERPMVTAGNAVGRAEGVGGSGAKAAIEREKERGAWRFAGAGAAAERTSGQIPRDDDEPAHTITGKNTHVWVGNQVPGGREKGDYQTRDGDAPAPTLTVGSRSAKIMRSNYGTGGDPAARGERAGDEPAPTVTSKADRNQWTHGEHGEPINPDPEKPATTVAGDPRLTSREHHYHGEQGTTSTRVTVAEAATLQSYPADFRWDAEIPDPRTGRTKPITKTNTFLQIGNAVPPGLAAAILREMLS